VGTKWLDMNFPKTRTATLHCIMETNEEVCLVYCIGVACKSRSVFGFLVRCPDKTSPYFRVHSPPLQAFGYNFRTANDQVKRDPVKWSLDWLQRSNTSHTSLPAAAIHHDDGVDRWVSRCVYFACLHFDLGVEPARLVVCLMVRICFLGR
jgi:hypothetical protein